MSDVPAPTRAEEGRELDPAVIAAAWGAWRIRHPHERLGPGPGFREAIAAALDVIGTSAQAEAEVTRLREEIAGWQRIAVIAAIPLEAMRAAGSYRALSPETQTSVDEAVVAIRMAVSGEWLPPYGDINIILAPVRTALEAPHAEN